MGVARAWSRWPTEIFSPSLMHATNLYLLNVGSKMAISIMVLAKLLPPYGLLFDHFFLENKISNNLSFSNTNVFEEDKFLKKKFD